MKSRIWFSVLLTACALVAGCTSAPNATEYVRESDIALLPHGCQAALPEGATAVSAGAIHDSNQVILETDQGSCVDDAQAILRVLEQDGRTRAAEQLSRFLEPRSATLPEPSATEQLSRFLDGATRADPSPHPDEGLGDETLVDPTVAGDPTPHPDVTAGNATSSDPSPHPDTSAHEDGESAFVFWIILFEEEGPVDFEREGPVVDRHRLEPSEPAPGPAGPEPYAPGPEPRSEEQSS